MADLDERLVRGSCFKDKDSLKKKVASYFIFTGFEYRIALSDSRRIHFKCSNPKCSVHIHAYKNKDAKLEERCNLASKLLISYYATLNCLLNNLSLIILEDLQVQ